MKQNCGWQGAKKIRQHAEVCKSLEIGVQISLASDRCKRDLTLCQVEKATCPHGPRCKVKSVLHLGRANLIKSA